MNFILRPWTPADIDSLVKYANNPKISGNLTDSFPYPYTRQSGEAFLSMAMRHQPNHILAIDIEGTASGAIGVHQQTDIFRKNAELGYWLAEPFWGQGIMSKAIKQMVDYGFQHWDIDRIFARPFGSNIGSQRALEKAGFTLEARFSKTFYKNDKYEDELVYAVRRKAQL